MNLNNALPQEGAPLLIADWMVLPQRHLVRRGDREVNTGPQSLWSDEGLAKFLDYARGFFGGLKFGSYWIFRSPAD